METCKHRYIVANYRITKDRGGAERQHAKGLICQFCLHEIDIESMREAKANGAQ